MTYGPAAIRVSAALIVSVFVLLLAPAARANHGPGTSGGGAGTLSGETLRRGAFELTARLDYTDFEHISRRRAEQLAAASGEEHGHFDTLNHSYLGTVSLEYGVTDDLTVGGQIGYYGADDFVAAHVHEDGGTGSHTGDIEGLTDLWLTAKYRLPRDLTRPGHLAVVGGVKAPVGDDDATLGGGEPVEPSSQPGTGAWDFQAGLAYSRYLTPRITLDASAIYTFRTEHDDFKVGDRLDAGLALNYRLTESIRRFPQYSVFGEALLVHLAKDEEDGGKEENSGGTTVYLSPGFRVRLDPKLAFTVAPQFPVLQDLNGEQVEARFKLAAALTFSF